MENNFFNNDSRIGIPSLFYDTLTGKPFSKCQVCEKEIMEHSTNYIIEKVFRKNIISGKIDVHFEFAICFDCAMNLTNSYSKESKENLQRFFTENVEQDFKKHQEVKLATERDVVEHLSACSITGKPVTELDEYQIIGQFTGQYINPAMAPVMIGSGAMDEVSDLLSNKTLDEIDDFTGKYLTGPPEFRDFFKAPKRRPILV
nr:hypothetical protein [Bacteroidota bacterium]